MKLGALKKVDLRKIWYHEAHDFTKWLAKEENISKLTEELDIDIENIILEASSGRYNVDILANEVHTSKKVIIENQLEVTDHKHLGQILTYASGHDASIIIWLVKDYREEHKQSIDWFNVNMAEAISFFLVKIELWQIGSSEVAPRFNIIAQPNDWTKAVKASNSDATFSKLKLQQQDFWNQFKEYANVNNTKLNLGRKSRPQHWYNISYGTSKANLSITFNSRNNYIGCEVYITNDYLLYEKYKKNKEVIEESLGYSLDWQDLPDSNAFRIQKTFPCKPLDTSKWNEYYEWINTTAEAFDKIFRKYT
jgi:hypothetical protein